MKNFAHRLVALERRLQPKVLAETVSDQRLGLPTRMAAHSPANADLLDRIRKWMEIHAPVSVVPESRWGDAWNIIGSLGRGSGYDVHGDRVCFPPAPTPAEQEAMTLFTEFAGALDEYEGATGDRLSLPFRDQRPPVVNPCDSGHPACFGLSDAAANLEQARAP